MTFPALIGILMFKSVEQAAIIISTRVYKYASRMLEIGHGNQCVLC